MDPKLIGLRSMSHLSVVFWCPVSYPKNVLQNNMTKVEMVEFILKGPKMLSHGYIISYNHSMVAVHVSWKSTDMKPS